ncbi:mitochondrial transcription rescue factor 1 [Episyrphus balteatus]|uniref:mitochondrial transcription rescue factor 1 n=1 Tax=Episyrphus balteatus TaxID=286459 RepID=UPI002485538C|nr:mitochondrial transcription rescue factor 1 [Episyrphus balteatus]
MLTNRFLRNFKHLRICNSILKTSSELPAILKYENTKNQTHIVVYPAVKLINTSTVFSKKVKKQSSKYEDSDSDDDDDDPHLQDERDSKVVKVKVNSLRADLLLKAGLQIARNKIEVIFYESKIRVNGQKIPKKSVQLNVGDEIDVIKGFSTVNPSHLVISRVIIASAKEKEETISVHLRRYKTMLIENYTGTNAYKSSESSGST